MSTDVWVQVPLLAPATAAAHMCGFYYAGVAELADALDLGSSVNDVGVQVPSPAPKIDKVRQNLVDFTFSLLPLHFSLKRLVDFWK